jgi:hypothetical protein
MQSTPHPPPALPVNRPSPSPPLSRTEDRRLLTGGGLFVHDMDWPGMLHGVFVRSDHAHARLVGVDVGAALDLPEVVRVLTGHDLPVLTLSAPNPLIPGIAGNSAPLLPTDTLLDVGHPVALALVLARTPEAAQRAAAAVWVDCQALPACTDHAPDAPTVAERAHRQGSARGGVALQVRVTQDQPRVVALAMEPRAMLARRHARAHWPWETRDDAHVAPEVAAHQFHLDGGSVEACRRMIHHMDEGIGQLLATLRDGGLLDDTLIVFTSDNGGERFSDNWPLVGGKMDLTEGGIRVPWIAHWPAVIPAGSTSDQHCLTMDWSATMLDLGGGRPHPDHPIDGVSLAPLLHDPSHRFARPMYWRMKHRGQRALREGDWKYLQVDGHESLFDIRADARECANLARRDPQRLLAMRERWLSWNATMPPIPPDATVSLGYGAADMPQR